MAEQMRTVLGVVLLISVFDHFYTLLCLFPLPLFCNHSSSAALLLALALALQAQLCG